MDLDMPRLDGIEATRRMLADRPGTAVLVLTAFSDRQRIMGALEAGACGYLLKDVAAEDVAEGIRAAARGESPLDPRAARTVLTRPRGTRSARRRSPPASARCSACCVEGLPNKLIARRLEISEKTVKSHLTRIFRELGVTDRTQAALWAERHGLGPGRAAAPLRPGFPPPASAPAAVVGVPSVRSGRSSSPRTARRGGGRRGRRGPMGTPPDSGPPLPSPRRPLTRRLPQARSSGAPPIPPP